MPTLDDGSQINSVMLAYAHEHNMVVGPLEELAGDPSGNLIQGMGGGVSDQHARLCAVPCTDRRYEELQ